MVGMGLSRAFARARGAASPVRDRREKKIRLPKKNISGNGGTRRQSRGVDREGNGVARALARGSRRGVERRDAPISA